MLPLPPTTIPLDKAFRTYFLDPADLSAVKAAIEGFELKVVIDVKYLALGGAASFLGQSLDAEKQGAKGGKFREYQGGSIYWHPATGAHEVHGDILAKYKQLGAENSFLGYPTTDVLQTPDEGHYSAFEGGLILLNPRKLPTTGEFGKKIVDAYEVHGAILSKYKDLNAYAGPLGYPLSDELEAGDGIGRVSRFDHGTIYWTSTTPGARGIWRHLLGVFTSLGASQLSWLSPK